VTTRTRPPFDPELEVALQALDGLLPSLASDEGLTAARQAIAAMSPSDEDLRRGGAVDVHERSIPGSDGTADLGLLICRPAGTNQPVPAIYHMHGGGMVAGDHRTGIGAAVDWVEELGLVLASVDYRLAPEHPHPTPVEDCYAGLVWTVDHAAALGIDPDRMVLAGTSAGGGLAAAVALMTRDRGGPSLIGQMLMCPMLDDRNETPSSHELDAEGVWDRHDNLAGWRALLGPAQGGPGVSPYAAPARAADLSGLPPAFIDVGSVETFRDEDVAYAIRIWQAGGAAELHVWPGGFHGFDQIAPDAALSRAARAARSDWLRRLLGPATGP
jgi:acetyl esterase/lipase